MGERRSTTEQAAVLSDVAPGDVLLVRRIQGQYERFYEKTVRKVLDTVVIAASGNSYGGKGVSSYRILDGREMTGSGMPGWARPMDEDARRMLAENRRRRRR